MLLVLWHTTQYATYVSHTRHNKINEISQFPVAYGSDSIIENNKLITKLFNQLNEEKYQKLVSV